MELKTLVKRYRVTMEESYDVEKSEGKTFEKWRYQEVKGKRGTIYPYAKDQLAVTYIHCSSSETAKGREWKLIQDGDIEKTYLFPLSDLDYVLKSIRPRKRPQMSPEFLERLKKNMANVRSKLKKD